MPVDAPSQAGMYSLKFYPLNHKLWRFGLDHLGNQEMLALVYRFDSRPF